MTATNFDSILHAHKSLYSCQPILFFDEIQNVRGWEHFARRLANQKYQVYITGSNARMLSRDIHTTLGSRFRDEIIYPYSFSEYIEAQGIKLSHGWEYGSQRDIVRRLLNDYILWGGFPECILYKDKRRWLNDAYEKILLNDIILRNRIKNELSLRLTIKRLAESVTKPISYNRIANLIKGTGISISPSTVMQYTGYAKDAFALFPLSNYASKFVEKETVKKFYFIDNGLLSIFLSESISPLLENVCAIQLLRQFGKELHFYNKNIEVDFYIPERRLAIQACANLSDDSTREREIKALIALDKLYDLQHMQIITLDEDSQHSLPSGKTIRILPLWKWLTTTPS